MMKIVCPHCTTSYDIGAAALGAGRQVRCARCKETWFATAEPEPAMAMAAAPAKAPAAAAAAPAKVDLDDEAAWGLAAEPEPAPKAAASTPTPPAAAERTAADVAADDDLEMAALQGTPDFTSDAPSIAPGDDPAAFAADGAAQNGDGIAEPEATPEPEDVESIAARRERQDKRRRMNAWLRPGPTSIILMLVAVVFCLYAFRTNIVRAMPQMGSLYALMGLPVNLRGLEIVDVQTSREVHEGVPVLVIEGAITNVLRTPLEVPRLRFSVRNEKSAELYAWTLLPQKPILSPNDRIAFRSRLASPPSEGKSVLVRFFNRRDIASGLR